MLNKMLKASYYPQKLSTLIYVTFPWKQFKMLKMLNKYIKGFEHLDLSTLILSGDNSTPKGLLKMLLLDLRSDKEPRP